MAHHELVDSAMATKIAHEIDLENKVGCMLVAGQGSLKRSKKKSFYCYKNVIASNGASIE